MVGWKKQVPYSRSPDWSHTPYTLRDFSSGIFNFLAGGSFFDLACLTKNIENISTQCNILAEIYREQWSSEVFLPG